ncbi:MAG TPA: hypothetical protein VE871_00130 [Longimicrobium sp.]|nr:hypothetical protein [Longimicrobium sp.]
MANPLSLFMRVLPGLTLQDVGAKLATLQPELDGALAKVNTVHYARTLFLDLSAPNLQPSLTGTGPWVIGVITAYDGDFNAYIQDFVNNAHEAFDAILSLVEGGAAVIPVKDNVVPFQKFIAANDASQHAPNNGTPLTPTSGDDPPVPGGLYQAYPQTVQLIKAAFS